MGFLLLCFLVAIEYLFVLGALALSQIWGLSIYGAAFMALASIVFISFFTGQAAKDVLR